AGRHVLRRVARAGRQCPGAAGRRRRCPDAAERCACAVGAIPRPSPPPSPHEDHHPPAPPPSSSQDHHPPPAPPPPPSSPPQHVHAGRPEEGVAAAFGKTR